MGIEISVTHIVSEMKTDDIVRFIMKTWAGHRHLSHTSHFHMENG